MVEKMSLFFEIVGIVVFFGYMLPCCLMLMMSIAKNGFFATFQKMLNFFKTL